MYDMSHVAGLLAGGLFQPEAGALADIVTSSTGKSLHAPDHGLCLFNDPSLATGIHDAVQPLLTSNTHPHELAALGVALAEMRKFGRDYAEQGSGTPNPCALPWDRDDQVSRLRLGSQVVTRRGIKEEEMDRVAEAIARILLHGDNPERVHRDLVAPLALEFRQVAYSFDDSFPLEGSWQADLLSAGAVRSRSGVLR